MNTGLPHSRVRTLFTFALSLLLGALLAAPTIAEGRKAACATHARHGAHACSSSAHHRKARGRRVQKRHDRVHGALPTRGAAGRAPASAAGASAASCEDGSAPVASRGGTLSCADDSEPTCEDGSSPRSGAGLCPVPTAQDPSASEATCEDSAGSPCAEDGEEPNAPDASCPEALSPEPMSEDSSLLCEREQ
jgi:hypothetical protein